MTFETASKENLSSIHAKFKEYRDLKGIILCYLIT